MPKPTSKSPRKKKESAKKTEKRLVGTRLSTPRNDTNKGKLKAIEQVFGRVALLRNKMSKSIRGNIHLLLGGDDRKSMVAGYKAFGDNTDLSAWETQALWQDTIGHYTETIKRVFSRANRTMVQGRQTPLTRAVDLLSTQPETIPAKGGAREIVDGIGARKGKAFLERVLAVAASRQKRLLARVKTHKYDSGTHRRNPREKGSKLVTDMGNGKYRHFMEFRLGNTKNKDRMGIVRVPVVFDPKRFTPEEMRNDSAYLVKWRKGKLHFHKTVEVEPPTFAEPSLSLGIDVNTARNIMACSDGTGVPVDEAWANHLSRSILGLGNPKNYNGKQKSKLTRLLRQNEGRIRKSVALLCDAKKAEGVSDIVMEDLAMACDATMVRGKNIDARQSRINRLLRLSAIKGWMKDSAEKRGIRLHLTHPGFTSQSCPSCGHTEKGNRKTQSFFKCLACGFAGDADTVAAINIERRLTIPSLRDGLHDHDSSGRLRPRFGRLADHRQAYLKALGTLGVSPENAIRGSLADFSPPETAGCAVGLGPPARSTVL